MSYTNGFKARQIQRMAGPERITANALAQETGVSQTTLSRWVREGHSVGGMANKKSKSTKGGARTRTGEDMLRILTAVSQLSEEALGAFLRKEGIHEATLRQWQEAAAAALASAGKPQRSKKSPEAKKITQLEKELHRKEKALAELAALITLQEKSPDPLGGRGRRHDHEERDMILGLIDEAISAGARLASGCEVLGLKPTTVQRWWRQALGEDRRAGPHTKLSNALSAAETAQILETVNTPEFRDKSPKQIVPT